MEGFLDYFDVKITKCHDAPGSQDINLIFLQPVQRFLQLLSEEGLAETDFLKDCLGVFQHNMNFCHITLLESLLVWQPNNIHFF